MIRTNFILALILLFLTQCGIENSSQRTWSTGIIENGNGLTCENLSINGIRRDSVITFTYGEEFEIQLLGMSGFNRIESLAYPGMSLTISDSYGETLGFSPDLFSKNQGGFDKNKLDLSATGIANLTPDKKNLYNIKVKVWDKKGKGEYSVEVPFKVLNNESLELENIGCAVEKVYLWNQTKNKSISNNKVSESDEIYFLLNRISGFKVKDELIFPKISVLGINEQDSILLKIDKEFKEGLNAEQFSKQFYIQMSFDLNDKHSEVVDLTFEVKDLKSEAIIKGRTEIEIKK